MSPRTVHAVKVSCFRLYDRAGGPYLLTLYHGLEGDDIPQARAVCDDFGNLVVVRGWR